MSASLTIYGIKQCNSVKKTWDWLDARQVPYHFVDFKKNPPTAALVAALLAAYPWNRVVNTRGTTWRQLDETQRSEMNADTARQIMLTKPSIIKRPIIERGSQYWLGFDETLLEQLITGSI